MRLNSLNITEYTNNSPLQEWFVSGKINSSKYLTHHISDILRILTLWKYTGTYFDLDVINKKPISSIGTNFACAEKSNMINSAIVNLDSSLGRSIAEDNFQRLKANYNKDSWSGNGPEILSSIIHERCVTRNTANMTRQNCRGFKVLPPEQCYAIHASDRDMFFDPRFVNDVMKSTENSFAIHFWNYLTRTKPLLTNSVAAYIVLAQQFCPRVFEASGESF